MTDDNIRGALHDMREVVTQMASMIPEKVDYYRAVDRPLASIQTEMKDALQVLIWLDSFYSVLPLPRLSVDIWQLKKKENPRYLSFLYLHLHRIMNGEDAVEPQFYFGLP